MRKFTLLCLGLMLTCIGAKAQFSQKITAIGDALTSVETFTDGYYLLWNNRGEACVRENTANNWLAMKAYSEVSSLVSTDPTARELRECVVYVTKDATTGTFKFQFQSGNYMGALANADLYTTSLANAETFTIEATTGDYDNAFTIKGNSNGMYANSNGAGNRFTGWSKEPNDGNRYYRLIPITVETCNIVDYVFKHKMGTEVLKTDVVECTIGEECTYSDVLDLNFVSVSQASFTGTVAVNDRVHEFVYTENLPFEYTTLDASGNFTSTPKLYKLKIRDTKYLKYNRNDANLSESQIVCGDYSSEECYWYFVKKAVRTDRAFVMNVYNLAEGTPLSVTDNPGDAYLANFHRSSTAIDFEVMENVNFGKEGFGLAPKGTSFGVNDYNNVLKLSNWGYADGGSQFTIEEVDIDLSTTLDFGIGNYVGNPYRFTSENEALSAAYQANKNPQTMAALYAAPRPEAVDGGIVLEDGKYYRIRSNRGGNELITSAGVSFDANGESGEGELNLKRISFDASDLSALWTPTKSGDGYTFKNANTGLYMYQPHLSETAAVWTLEEVESCKWLLQCPEKEGNNYLSALGGPNYETVGVYTRNWGSSVDLGNIWKIEEVTSVPLTLDATGWASLVLPYNVEVPADVTVYYAKSTSTNADNQLMLTKWETDVIPADVPVFLKGTENATLDLTITTADATTAAEGNMLSGATMRRTKEGGNWGVYGLKKDAGALAPAAAALETLPANRAFIALDGVSTVAEVRFAFGDLTGIEDIPAAALQTEEVYYDLSGRRVWAPKNGIFVTASGKKVFIK